METLLFILFGTVCAFITFSFIKQQEHTANSKAGLIEIEKKKEEVLTLFSSIVDTHNTLMLDVQALKQKQETLQLQISMRK